MSTMESKSGGEIGTPNHVAIIMDGNGRWATSRGLPRTLGHKQGAEALKRCVRAAGDLGIPYITLFGFSCENWSRPEGEVKELMRLLRLYLRAETAELQKNNIRLKIIGHRDELAPDIVRLIENAENISKDNTGLTLMIAINYGGQQDILEAAYRTAQQCIEDGALPEKEKFQNNLAGHLSTAGCPDPDLLIRTSGEQRISNFLLWQCAYSEMFFTNTLWPDFQKSDLEEAIGWYQDRDRRFGGLTSKTSISSSKGPLGN